MYSRRFTLLGRGMHKDLSIEATEHPRQWQASKVFTTQICCPQVEADACAVLAPLPQYKPSSFLMRRQKPFYVSTYERHACKWIYTLRDIRGDKEPCRKK